MNLKISSLLVVLSLCTIDTNCSAADSKYMINYDNISGNMILKLESLAKKNYTDANTLSDICDIFISKLNKLDYECSGSPFHSAFTYHPVLKLFQVAGQRINRNIANAILPSLLLSVLDPGLAMIFFGGNAVNAFFTRNVPGRVTYKIYNDFINEYNEFANAVSNFMNTHDIDDITASQNLQRKWNSSLEFQNTFSVAIKDFLKILNTENMITSVQNIKCYTKAKPVFEMYFLKFMSQIDSIDENDIYNDYSRQMKEKYESFVKEMYKQINTLNGNNFSDKELQKAWGLVLFQHGLKLEDKLDKFKQAYTENDYTLKNFYELFPIVDLKAMKDYAKKELFLY